MKTTSVKAEGQIISSEIFDKIDSEDIKGQLPKDYNLEQGVKVKDEIQRAWANAKDQWRIFNRNVENLPPNHTGTSETRRHWIIPFLDNLGYTVSSGKAEYVNEKSYAISHRANNLGSFPVHIVSYRESLDKRRDTTGPRLSPHALLQEYLNLTEHLYGIVTNGSQLRILRDSGKLIRLTYLEFDLRKMMEEDLYAEFSIMFRLIHSTRMPQTPDEGELSIIEQYHQRSLEAGERIREKLSEAVEKSIVLLAEGFLNNPANFELREQFRKGVYNNENFYQKLLRFIYRILFLMVIEERDIVYPENGEKTKYFREIYYKYYSVSRLRDLSEKIFFFNDKLNDLWIHLKNCFLLFSNKNYSEKLGLYPLNGDLFDSGALGLLINSELDNRSLLECIRYLGQFEDNETHSIVRVNYSALNVEEFGSVYEGLLEKSPDITKVGERFRFTFIKGDERSTSGSHYTPEELVQPLIKHSLEFIIEDKLNIGEKNIPSEELIKKKEKALLSIKVCDAACGSGHILLSAARKIAQELTKVRTGEDQPSPGPFREAVRDVISGCIYGVDKNPLAVELCKVALWLEAHNPGLPLNFLDNKIREGNSIIGLARLEELYTGISTEAFKTLPGDDKKIAAMFRNENKKNIKDRGSFTLFDKQEVIEKLDNISVSFSGFNALPDYTVEQVKKKAEEYETLKDKNWWPLKELADIKTAQFFIPKTDENKNFLTTDARYFRIFAGEREKNERRISHARAAAARKQFFHWFLEFPEVMSKGGFDCIVGNPPFLGDKRLTGTFGKEFLEWVKSEYAPAGSCDLVTYFFRRIFDLLKPEGFMALISTNTIAQGTSREGGLDVILKRKGEINFAIRSKRWPGKAAVEVSLVNIFKGKWKKDFYLGSKKTKFISAYLDDSKVQGNPYPLKQNEGKSFIGSYVLGMGFILEPEEAENLIKNNHKNKDVLFPYLNGEDLNTSPEQKPSRWVINFFDWPLKRMDFEEWSDLKKEEREKIIKEGIYAPPYYEKPVAEDYPDCLSIIENKVKPERTRWKKDADGNDIVGVYALRKPMPQKWWIYAEKRPALYSTIAGMERVLVVAQVSKYPNFAFTKSDQVLDSKLIVITDQNFSIFTLLQSSIHNFWITKYATTLETRLNYTNSALFLPFPFPLNFELLEKIGTHYYEFRGQIMLELQLGLTKTYNLFHNRECNIYNLEKGKEIREFKQGEMSIPFEEAVLKIEKLRKLHKEMDEAVLEAYGWDDIHPAHDFYEVDYLPENDNIRYTISPEAGKEILKRLLELNHKIHDKEVKGGLWDKKNSKRAKKNKSTNKRDTETEDLFGGRE